MGRFSEYSNCGKMMILIGLLVGVPMIVPFFYTENIECIASFAFPSVFSILLGIIVCRFIKSGRSSNNDDDGSLTVLFTWFWGITMGALPFIIGGILSPVKAFFESVSGWTTTGLSVIEDVSVTPEIFLFHRSFMQFCGGLGFVMVMTLFISGKQSMNLFNAEGHPDKLMPNLKKTSQTICLIYCGFLALGTIAYRLAGISIFDALNHTMCALSTGGFSTKNSSIGEFNSLAVEGVSIVLMIVGMTNFAVLMLLVKRKWKQLLRVAELRFTVVLLAVFVPIVTISIVHRTGVSLFSGFRQALFGMVTANSTTGFSNFDYKQWPQLCLGIFIIFMFIGGGLGSTAGGLKLSRVYLMLKFACLSIKKKLMPSSIVEIPYFYKAQGKTEIDDYMVLDTAGFVVTYISVLAVMSLCLIASSNCTVLEAVFEVASCMSGTGISIGITNSSTAESSLIIEMICMILGRLEIIIVITGIYSAVKRVERAVRNIKK